MGLIKVSAGIEDLLQGMLDRSKATQGYLNRIVYKQYQNAQRERWMSENSSEGNTWKPLNPAYAASKKKRFASYPGQGTKMLIATGRLMKAVIGPGDEHRKLVTPNSIEVGWTTPYAVYVDEVRSFSEFGEKTMEDIYDGISKFLFEGIMRELK